jgi:hypothetical protein
MKPDKFLLGALWTVALVLLADFWFDIRFGFNIFLRDHWRFLADIQTGTDSVSIVFYVSLFLFAIILPAGLYYISAPKRRIRIKKEEIEKEILKPEPVSTNNSQLITHNSPAVPAMQRPPSMIIPGHLQNISLSPTPALTPSPTPSPVQTNNESEIKVRDIITGAGFITMTPPRIMGEQLSIWATGTDEVLIIGKIIKVSGDVSAYEGPEATWTDANGRFDSPVGTLSSSVDKIKQLVSDTLDDSIKIQYRSFLFVDGGRLTNKDMFGGIGRDYGIREFDDMTLLREWIMASPNKPVPTAEIEDFEAYKDYINTIADYFNNAN